MRRRHHLGATPQLVAVLGMRKDVVTLRKLTQRQRRILQLYHGMPAKAVATAERMTIAEVVEIRLDLRARGLVPGIPVEVEPEPQMTLDDVDRIMRENRAPDSRVQP